MGENTTSKAEEIRASVRKVVELPSGFCIEIRKIGPVVLAAAQGGIPDLSALATADKGEGATLDPKMAERGIEAIQKIIEAAATEPSFRPGNAEGLAVDDLEWQDQLALFTAIMEHSGWTKAAAGEVLPLSATST